MQTPCSLLYHFHSLAEARFFPPRRINARIWRDEKAKKKIYKKSAIFWRKLKPSESWKVQKMEMYIPICYFQLHLQLVSDVNYFSLLSRVINQHTDYDYDYDTTTIDSRCKLSTRGMCSEKGNQGQHKKRPHSQQPARHPIVFSNTLIVISFEAITRWNSFLYEVRIITAPRSSIIFFKHTHWPSERMEANRKSENSPI